MVQATALKRMSLMHGSTRPFGALLNQARVKCMATGRVETAAGIQRGAEAAEGRGSGAEAAGPVQEGAPGCEGGEPRAARRPPPPLHSSERGLGGHQLERRS